MTGNLKWFRFYAEVLHDPKVQKLPPQLFKDWVNVLCLAAQNEGSIPANMDDMAFSMRLSRERVSRIIADLQRYGLIDVTENHISPHNWEERQFKSDSSADRMRKLRERKKSSRAVTGDGGVTSHVTPPEQSRTEQNRECDVTTVTAELDHEQEFSRRWDRWPLKGRIRQPLCQQLWCEVFLPLDPAESRSLLAKIDSGIDRWLTSRQFEKGMVFGFADFLAQRRWSEHPEQAASQMEEPFSNEEIEAHWQEFQRLTRQGMKSDTAEEQARKMIYDRRRNAKAAAR